MIRITAKAISDDHELSISAEVPGALDEAHMSSLARLLIQALLEDEDDDGEPGFIAPSPRQPVNRN